MTPTIADYTQGIQSRHHDLELRATGQTDEAREVAGIGVPYGEEVELFAGWYETIAPDAVQPRAHRMLFYRHNEPIGLIIGEDQDAKGWTYRAKISDTAAGRDAHTLARDGVVVSSSIGFKPIEWTETRDEDGVHITHTKIDVLEVSLVPIPAYESASITEVRHATQPTSKENPNMNATAPEQLEAITELRSSVDELARTVDLIRTAPDTNHQGNVVPLGEFRSFGDYVKKLAAGDEVAARAFEGAVLGDTIVHDKWVGDVIRLMQDRYRVTSLFRHTSDLPAEGNTLEYGLLESDTITVEEQEAEGDDLAFGKVSLTTATAGVKTYGGWTSLSRQSIERSSIGVLDISFRALAMRYAKAIELATRTLFNTAHTAALASVDGADKVMLGDATPVALASADADDWLATVLALMEHFDGKNYNLDGLIASKDVFLALAAVPEEKKMLQVTGVPTDKGGTLSVDVPSANLFGLRVTYAPYLSAGVLGAYDRQAIRIQEAPGAPFRLQDENIVNLTKQFSVYGYASHYQQLAGGIVAIDTTGGI